MTSTALLAELHGAGIRLSLHGDALRVEAKPGALSADLRERLASAKQELVTCLQSDLRTRLHAIAESDEARTLVERLPVADVVACNGLVDDTLRAYLRALQRGCGHRARGLHPGDALRRLRAGVAMAWLACARRRLPVVLPPQGREGNPASRHATAGGVTA